MEAMTNHNETTDDERPLAGWERNHDPAKGDALTVTMERDGETADISGAYKHRPDGDGWLLHDADHSIHYYIVPDGNDELEIARGSAGELDRLGTVVGIEESL